MNIKFKNISLKVSEGTVITDEFCGCKNLSENGFAEVQIAGENKPTHEGAKLINSSEGIRLKYFSHKTDGNTLTLVQKSGLVQTETVFQCFDNTNAVRVYTSVTNISDDDIVLEDVSAMVVRGISSCGISAMEDMYFTKFIQSHHGECQALTDSFYDLGFISDPAQSPTQKRIHYANVGSWSTKEQLPQGIIEDRRAGKVFMFQIESSSSWYYEISDRLGDMYIYLGGANSTHHSWWKKLSPGESYHTPAVAFCTGSDLNDVLAQMTVYRRYISGLSDADKNLPVIFNEYMHMSWDSPTEENTKIIAPVVAELGAQYYVIDCGWHDEVPGEVIYPEVGRWVESKVRFPSGLRKTTDYIRSLGMKAGLWIEPEIVGINCSEMLAYYGDECFYSRFGKKVANHRRYFLDYRHPKVVEYMTETIRRMVEDYGADYIKFDYNQDCGIGTERDAMSPGEGLEKATAAFFAWVESMKKRFPQVIFEGCASGGMRMDYSSLSVFSLVSTSDQTNYLKYPYIASNILAAVIPEQAAVWSYPVAWLKKENISENATVMNMINSFLGRMHLASHVDWLDDRQKKNVSDGIKYYNKLSEIKQRAVPYLPSGFSRFGDKVLCSGLKDGNKLYLAVWNLSDINYYKTEFGSSILGASLVYPSEPCASVSTDGSVLEVKFTSEKSAVFIEVELENKEVL